MNVRVSNQYCMQYAAELPKIRLTRTQRWKIEEAKGILPLNYYDNFSILIELGNYIRPLLICNIHFRSFHLSSKLLSSPVFRLSFRCLSATNALCLQLYLLVVKELLRVSCSEL